MEKILVTGAAGFIAAKVVEKLLKAGQAVVGIDNLNDYYDPELKKHRLSQLQHKNFEFLPLDIENKQGIQALFKKHSFQTVYNLAARAGVRYSLLHPDVYLSTNAQGTLNLLEAMKEKGGKFILASTSSLYAGQKMPFLETLPVNTPISPYAATKKAAEVMSYTYHQLYGIDVSVVRYFTVYGPAGRPDMSPFIFTEKMLKDEKLPVFGDGTQARDFTFVDDIAEGTILASKKLGFEVINLGGGRKPYSLNQMIQILEEKTGKKAQIQFGQTAPGDMDVTWADIQKAKDLLSWEPKVDFVEGLERTLHWHQKNLGKFLL